MFRGSSTVKEGLYPELNDSKFVFRFYLKTILRRSCKNINFNLKEIRKYVSSNLINHSTFLLTNGEKLALKIIKSGSNFLSSVPQFSKQHCFL
jgi:hypothetical protein